MEYKIGETFEFNGKKIKYVSSIESDDVCELCALNHTELCTPKFACIPFFRKDKLDVYSIELKEENNMPSRKLNDNENVKKQIITPPEGYEIDKENSTFECIKFKKKEEQQFRYDETKRISGYWIDEDCAINSIDDVNNTNNNHNLFVTEKQAKSALAMAQISQIMANDSRFGGVITDKEWEHYIVKKYVIYRKGSNIVVDDAYTYYKFLAFHTKEQLNLFLKENEDLIKDYLMID